MEVLETYDNVEIKQLEGHPTPSYLVVQPKFTDEEKKLIANPKKMVPPSEIEFLRAQPDVSSRWDVLKERILKKMPDTPNKEYVARKIVGIALGYGDIGLLISDDNLEEVMINGIAVPVYVYHRKYGMCKTNIAFSNTDAINKVIYEMGVLKNAS